MALKLFLIYIGTFFVGSFAMFAIVRQLVSGFSGTRPILYGLLSSAITSLVALGAIYLIGDLFTAYWTLSGIFLLFGIIHVLLTHKRYFLPREEQVKVLIGELLFTLSVLFFTMVIFSVLLYFLKDKSFLFYPLLFSGLLFLLPYLVIHTFHAAYEIPTAVFTTWRYPVTQAIDPPEDNGNDRLLVIGFEIAKKSADIKKTYFRARAPENIALGELYYHFINDYNELQSETPIDFLDDRSGAYNWWFRIKPRWYQAQRILNPLLTIKDNGIQENSVIICERIVTPAQDK